MSILAGKTVDVEGEVRALETELSKGDWAGIRCNAGDAKVIHLCLAGEKVSCNRSLFRELVRFGQLTAVRQLSHLCFNSLLSTVDILILDLSDDCDYGLSIIAPLKSAYPRLEIVLVNGGLSEDQKACAFKCGARDYFRHSTDTDIVLLVQRVRFLADEAKRLCQS